MSDDYWPECNGDHGYFEDQMEKLRARLAEVEAELERLRAVVEAARQAYRADAVAEWFDAEGDGLRAALAALLAKDAKG